MKMRERVKRQKRDEAVEMSVKKGPSKAHKPMFTCQYDNRGWKDG